MRTESTRREVHARRSAAWLLLPLCLIALHCGSRTDLSLAGFASLSTQGGSAGGGDASAGGNGSDAAANSSDAGGVRGGGPCVPKTCADVSANCGAIVDGCGGTARCGACPSGQTCGAAGANKCGMGSCMATTCGAVGATCGSIPDGCGRTVDCGGGCPPGQTCGGGGPNACGTAVCTPMDPCQMFECGSYTDGCGKAVTCGNCMANEACIMGTCTAIDAGGAGAPGQGGQGD